nr:MAG: replication initiation protein [Microvirus Sku13]
MESIKCQHPVILLNPQFKSDVRRYGELEVFTPYGVVSTFDNCGIWRFSPQWIKCQFFHLPKETLTSIEADGLCYYYKTPIGNCVPLYLVVPCGKCALCLHDKRDDWSNRCELESISANSNYPVFMTFTYDEEHVPYTDNRTIVHRPKFYRNNKELPTHIFVPKKRTVKKTDIQLMLKRFRQAIERNLIGGKEWNKKHPLRYLIVSEYGSNGTCRPHYHAIFWNFPTPQMFGIPKGLAKPVEDARYIGAVKTFFQSSLTYVNRFGKEVHSMPIWDKCSRFRLDFDYCGVKTIKDPSGRIVERITKNVGNAKFTAKYCAKYVTKGSNVPFGSLPNFLLASNRGGGIGMHAIKLMAHDIREHILNKLSVFNPITRELTTMPVPKLAKARMFRTTSRLRTPKVTELLKNAIYHYTVFHDFYKIIFDESIPMDSQLADILETLFPTWYNYKPDVSNLKHLPFNPTAIKPIFDDNMDMYFEPKDTAAIDMSNLLFDNYLDSLEDLFSYEFTFEDNKYTILDFLPEAGRLLAITSQRTKFLQNVPRETYDVEELARQAEYHFNLRYIHTSC